MSVTPHSHSQHSQQHAHITTAEPAALHAHQHAHTGLRYHSPHTTLPLARSHTSSHTPTPSTGIRILAHTSTGTSSTAALAMDREAKPRGWAEGAAYPGELAATEAWHHHSRVVND